MHRLFVLVLFTLAFCTLVGCSRQSSKAELPQAEQNLRTIAEVYLEASATLGRPPKAMEELQPYLTRRVGGDSCLISPIDGQPLTIIWNVSMAGRKGVAVPILAYESDGKSGLRKAIDLRMGIRALTDDEVAKLARR